MVTPDVQRLVGSAAASSPSPVHSLRLGASGRYKKPFLMSTDEAYVKVHGDIETLRDGDQTHQNIQTNLADIISGGEFEPLPPCSVRRTTIPYETTTRLVIWKSG